MLVSQRVQNSRSGPYRGPTRSAPPPHRPRLTRSDRWTDPVATVTSAVTTGRRQSRQSWARLNRHDGPRASQNRIFAASCTFRGSPAPMPGAPLPLRVFVIKPTLVELDNVVPGLFQLFVLNTLK